MGLFLNRWSAQELLWRLDLSYDDSKGLLAETAAAVEMIKYGAGGLDLGGIDAVLVSVFFRYFGLSFLCIGLSINVTSYEAWSCNLPVKWE